MWPKVMNFVGILKNPNFIELGEDFKPNPLVLKKVGFGSEMENPHH